MTRPSGKAVEPTSPASARSRSGAGSLTGNDPDTGPAGSLPTRSTNGRDPSSSVSMQTTATIVIRWEELSERGAALMRQVGTRICEGYSETEIAKELQTSTRSISAALVELQDELRRLA